MGKPSDAEEYDIIEDNGITVYVKQDVQTQDDGLNVSTAKLLFKENLIVEGIVY